MGREDVERAVVDELLQRLVAPGHDGLHQAHHGLPLVAVQRVTHEHEPLVPQPLQQQRRVEPALVVLLAAIMHTY